MKAIQIRIMKKHFTINLWMLISLIIPQHLLSQVLVTEFDIPENRGLVFSECLSAGNGSAMFAVGRTASLSYYSRYCKGVVAKVDADGTLISLAQTMKACKAKR